MIIFQKDGSPFSTRFDDIYFDTNQGYQQSQSVFIDGNNIEAQLKNCADNFTIAETGFGSGLNFILTLVAFEKIYGNQLANAPTLTFISTEKYPLTHKQLAQTLALWPHFSAYTEPLLAQYPQITSAQADNDAYLGKSCRCSFYDSKVKLQLYFNDATLTFAQLAQQKKRLIDAWYLDGFSPKKNPDMWSKALFEQIELLSKEQATLATFTSAGFVRRHLSNHGFRILKTRAKEKAPPQASAKKKQYLRAVFQQSASFNKGYQLRPLITKPQHVAIIGGGIASACAAYSLTKQGVKVTLYCKDDEIAQGASSNAIGALYPLIHQQADEISLFYQQAFGHAKALYQSLLDQGFDFAHSWCGLLELAYKDALKKRQTSFEQLNAWPKALIHSVTAEQASEYANIKLNHGGLFIPQAGWINPPQLVKQLFAAAKATNRLRIKTNTEITHLEQEADNKWRLHSDKGQFNASTVVVCSGAETLALNITKQLPLSSVRGQVTSINSNKKMLPLTTVLCHKGYLTPAHNNKHCIGATFTKDSFDCQAKVADDHYNLAMLEACLPNLTGWQKGDINGGKARLRCMSPDHLPLVGPMPNIQAHIDQYPHLSTDKNWRYQTPAPCINGLYLLTGLGARGLCSAPLLADILAADICGTPYPVNNQQLFNLAPNRFVIRDIIKRKC